MQENEYKQNYKMLVIKGLHKFFININRQFRIITKKNCFTMVYTI